MNTSKCNAAFLDVEQAYRCESEDWEYVVPLSMAKELETQVQELREALESAAEELRLIRMKDFPAVYDPTLRIRIAAILEKTK